MKLSYHGHSVVKIETGDFTILIDPFISGNGQTDLQVGDVSPTHIVLTHGHNDHVGDTIQLAKEHGALVIATFELADYLETQGAKTHGMGIGGARKFDFGHVKFTQAFHSSSYTDDQGTVHYTGMPAGVVLTIEETTIYHAGDTGLFSDMKLIGEQGIDVAFLPIGDNFTMGPRDAARAVEFIEPRIVVPMHYNTFPPIEQDPEHFKSLVHSADVQILKAGEEVQN